MIPRSLRLQNFMSYGDNVPPLDFASFSTACLTGDNGHGKSTLLDAITWALWGETRAKSIDDVVRLGQDDAAVEFVFDLESERYRVIRKRSVRTRQSALELQGFDWATDSFRAISGNSIRETEAKIVQLLHMNYDTFVNSVFVLQGRADAFTMRRPAERKRILADILGLSIYDALEERAKMRRNEMDQDVRALHQRLTELHQDVAQKDTLEQAVQTHQAALSAIQAAVQEAQQRLEQLRQRQSDLEVQSQRAGDVARRVQQLQHERLELEQQLTAQTRRLADYETILQQEPAIVAGYQTLQQLRAQEQLASTQAEEYTALQQRQALLQQAINTAQYRLELEQQAAQQRCRELEHTLHACDTLLHEAPRITAAYTSMQSARQRDAALAQAMQRRYALEQEKSQLESSIQHKRHALALEQRSLLDRQQEWQQQEASLPTWEQQVVTVQQQLATVEEHAKRLEQIRTDGTTIRMQLETTLPQMQATLQQEMHEQEEKRTLLTAASAHCPLCEKSLTDHERQRVMHKLAQEVARRESRLKELQREQQQLLQQRQQLRLEYKQVEQHVAQRQQLDQHYAVAQTRVAEAMQARTHLVGVLQTLQDLETRLQDGSYARAEFERLHQLQAEMDGLAYDAQEHAAIKHTLATLADAELQHARLLQVDAERTTLRQQHQEALQHDATLTQTLTSAQFAMAERVECHSVSERLNRLDYRPAAHQALRQRLQEQQYVERQHLQLEAARAHLVEARTVLQGLQTRQQRLSADMTALEQERQHYAQELSAFDSVQHAVSQADEELRALRSQEGAIRVALGRSQSQHEHCLRQAEELQQKQQQHDQATTERTLYGDLAQMFGKNGIQAIMIENAIPELEEEANRLLSRVTSNAMHLTLETQRDVRSGGVAETLDIKISDELGTRNYEMFSGGEAFRINFAIRIALAKMLARRAGARLRTLVIDEGFGTQDTEGLERLVEVIKAIQGDFAKIIVITHLRELKNAFETHIEVKKDPVRGSWYQVL